MWEFGQEMGELRQVGKNQKISKLNEWSLLNWSRIAVAWEPCVPKDMVMRWIVLRYAVMSLSTGCLFVVCCVGRRSSWLRLPWAYDVR